jgi:hypothetical protein
MYFKSYRGIFLNLIVYLTTVLALKSNNPVNFVQCSHDMRRGTKLVHL